MEIMKRQYRPLLQRAIRILKQPRDAERAVQTVYLKAYLSCDSLRTKDSCIAWLSRMLDHECAIRIPAQKQWALPQAAGPCVQRSAEELAALRALFSSLPPADKPIIYLHYIVDIRVSDMAKLLSLPEPTVKRRLLRARRRFQKRLANSADRDGSGALSMAGWRNRLRMLW